jgi:hypothetical protein
MQETAGKRQKTKGVKMATKEITITTATLEVNGEIYEAIGQIGEFGDWIVRLSFDPRTRGVVAGRDWIAKDEYIVDEDELQEFLWDQFMRITKKYHSISIKAETEEVEADDEDEE